MSKDCVVCENEIEPPERAEFSKLCLQCGEVQARVERKSWCVVQVNDTKGLSIPTYTYIE